MVEGKAGGFQASAIRPSQPGTPRRPAGLGSRTFSAGPGIGAVVCVLGALGLPRTAAAAFTNVTGAAGLGDTGGAYSIAWGDYDNDGDPDLWIADYVDSTATLYENNGNGTFTATGECTTGKRAGAWADYDNDGDRDLFAALQGYLYENNGDGTFTERASEAGVVGANMGMTCWLDYDADGDLDLFFPNGDIPWNELRENLGDGAFTTVNGAAIGLDNGEGNGECCTAADVDNDGDIDIYYNSASRATTSPNARLYFNNGDKTFTENAAGAGVAISMGTNQPYYAPVFGDYNNDGYLDLFLGHPATFANRLYSNDGDGTFTLASASNVCVDKGHSRGATWGDYDNDGDLDLLVGNDGAANCLYRNNGDGTFTDVAAGLGITGGTSATKSVSLADYDNDGDLDIYYANDAQANVLFRNDLNDTNHLRVKVTGLGLGFSPRDGTGSRVELYDAAGSTLLAVREVSGGGGYGSQEPDIQHFGLASAWGGGDGTYTVKVGFTSGLTVTRSGVVPTSETIVVGVTTLQNAIEVVESFGYPPPKPYTIGTHSLAVDVAAVTGGSAEWTVELLGSPDLSRVAANDKFTDAVGKAWKITAVDDANDLFSVIDSEGNLGSPAQPGSWWNTDWTRRRKITFDNSTQAENLFNFQLLVKLDATRVDYSQTQDAGEDIRFVDADGVSVLTYEIEDWNEGGASYVWVKVPRIDGGSNTDHIWVYYGNTSAADAQNAEDVWTANYKGVWHLHDDFLTSTWHANDGTNSGSVDIPSKIADGQDFPGTNSGANGEYVNIPNTSTLQNIQENNYTRSAWFYPDTTPPGTGSDNDANYAIIAKPGNHEAVAYTNGNNFRVEHWLTTGQVGVTSANTFAPGDYYHVVSVISRTDGTSKLYVNGQLEGTETFTAGAATREYGTVTWRIGCANPTGLTYRWAADGQIDEVRIATGLLSDDWIAAQYKSEGDTFCTYGGEDTQVSAATTGTVSRWFTTIQAWEDAREGDLVARDAVEKGVCHNDSVFNEQVTISGSVTDADHYMWLTVASGERHNGKAGAGVRMDRAGAANTTLSIADDYVTVEWLEICNDTLTDGGTIDHSGASYVTYRNVMVHDVGFDAIRGDTTSGSTTYINTVVYNAGADGLEFRTDTDAAYNCTVYNCTDATSGRGYRIAPPGVYPTVRNCIAAGNRVDFDDRADAGFSASSGNNISTDSTAPGTGSQPGVPASALFFSVTAGSEDLHLRPSASAIDVGADLSAVLTDDIDGTPRPLGPGWDIGADEWNPEVFPAGTNYRSIGTNAGVLYGTGTASVSTGSTAVTLGGGASLPKNVWVGDRLVLDPAGPGKEIFYVLSRDSSTQLTVQPAAAWDHTNDAFEIRRAFNSISLWEAAREGDLVAENRTEVGVCFNDGTFTDNVVIDGSTTDADHYMALTVAAGQRHDGTAGTGVVVDPSADGNAFTVSDDYVQVEGLEVTGWTGTSSEAFRVNNTGFGIRYCLIHDAESHDDSDGIFVGSSGITVDVENCIFYDIARTAVNIQNKQNATVNVRNVTVYNAKSLQTSVYYCGLGFDRWDTRDNTGSVFNVENCYVHTVNGNAFHTGPAATPGAYGTFDNNASADATADDFGGAGNLVNRDPANQFANLAAGGEDLHLTSGAEIVDSGKTLTAFSDDIDRQTRSDPWDIGADEFMPPQPLTVTVPAGAAEGDAPVQGTVTVPVAVSVDLMVGLVSDDTSEATVPATVTIQPGTSSATFDVTIVDDGEIDGDQVVTVTASAAGCIDGSDTITIQDDESTDITVDIAPATALEGDGVLADQGTVSIAGTLGAELVIDLSSDDTTELTVPASVTISPGSTSASFSLTVEDDPDTDGTQPVTVTASASGWTSGSDTIDILDDEAPSLTLAVSPDTAAEGAGTLAGTVTVPAAVGADLTVSLVSDDISEATVPATVTIQTGTSSVTFDVTIVDDGEIDGDQVATVTASAAGYLDGTDTITVQDDESTDITVDIAPATAVEGQGVLTGQGTVSIAGTLGSGLVIDLSSDDTTELTVPVSVTIQAGSTSASFDLTVVDDGEIDGEQVVTVTASAAGFVDGSDTITVQDDESTITLEIIPDTATEGEGVLTGEGTVSISVAPGADLVVALTSSNATELTVPASVTIQAGNTSVSFDLTVVDDAEIDGPRTVTVTASASGWVGGSDTVLILDDEPGDGGIGGGAGGCDAGGAVLWPVWLVFLLAAAALRRDYRAT